jgi:hypothetical protein
MKAPVPDRARGGAANTPRPEHHQIECQQNRVNIPCVRSPLSRQPLAAPSLRSFFLALLAALFGICRPLEADSPLRPPAKFTVCSPNHAFCAVADPAAGSVSVLARGASFPVWSLKGWHRQIFLADDGDHLVIGPEGLDLLPLETRPGDPLLVFMKRTAVVRVVPVGELFARVSSLPRTASHYAWGRIAGISARGQLVVQLVNGRRLAYNVFTGRVEAEK